MPRRRVLKTRAMQVIEQRLGADLEDWIPTAYLTKTQAQVADELGIDQTTLSRWMERLDIEARFQGQKPPAEGAVA